MNDGTDPQLLRAYAESRSEAAFAELVRRHVDFVYSAALGMVRDSHLAEDVTQSVFAAFAKNAAQLTNRRVMSGWLHRTAQNIAAQTVRTIERRRAREREAVAMNELLAADPNASRGSLPTYLVGGPSPARLLFLIFATMWTCGSTSSATSYRMAKPRTIATSEGLSL